MQPQVLKTDPTRLAGLSARLVTSHYQNNYGGAIKRLNAIREELGRVDWSVAPGFAINGLKREELIAANSAWLHELYFDVLGGDGQVPPGGMSVALERDFVSVDRWRREFTALAKAMGGGSGWALLSWSTREARLVNHWAADHTHLLAGATPVLALDMYEHAYHIDYGAGASAYVDAYMQNVDWQVVHRRYSDAVASDAVALTAKPTDLEGARQIIDVRRAATYAAAGDLLAGAVWRDPVGMADWSSEIDRSAPVFVYCAHGLDIGRSTALGLRARGLDARFIEGGIEGCRAAGVTLTNKGARR